MKHTPGPWRFTDDWIAVCDSTGTIVASLDSDGAPDVGLEESLANARLIAAAPKMLAALRVCESVLRIRGYQNAAEIAQEAIADAQGVRP